MSFDTQVRWWIRLNRTLLWFLDDEHSNNYVLGRGIALCLLDSASCREKDCSAHIHIAVSPYALGFLSKDVSISFYTVVDLMHGAGPKMPTLQP